MEMREILAAFAIKYNGELLEILKALDRNEPITTDGLAEFKSKLKYNYVTIIDDNYPELFKHISNPPIVLFYKGNLNLLSNENHIIAKSTDKGVRMFHAIDPSFTSKGIELDYVMSCECHDDMDMLMNKMLKTHEQLKSCDIITHERQTETHRNIH